MINEIIYYSMGAFIMYLARFLTIILTLTFATHSYSISVNTANGIAVTAAIVTGIGAGALAYGITTSKDTDLDEKESEKITESKWNIAKACLWGTATAVTVGFSSRWLLYTFTPAYKWNLVANCKKEIQVKMDIINKDPIANQVFEQPQDLLQAIQAHYVRNELWLVTAFESISRLMYDAERVCDLANKIRAEAAGDAQMLEEANKITKDAQAAITKLTNVLIIIRNDVRYKEQRAAVQEREWQMREEANRQRERDSLRPHIVYPYNNGAPRVNLLCMQPPHLYRFVYTRNPF